MPLRRRIEDREFGSMNSENANGSIFDDPSGSAALHRRSKLLSGSLRSLRQYTLGNLENHITRRFFLNTPGTSDCVKTALSAAAQNLTSFCMAQAKTKSLSEEGLPGEEESSLEEVETAENCVMMSAA